MARTVWLDVIERLNEALGSYELKITRDLVDVSLARPVAPGAEDAHAPIVQQAYAYRVELSKDGVMASVSGLDQPEVVLPQLCLRLLTHVGVQQTAPRQRTEGYEAFKAALESTRLERGIEDAPRAGESIDEEEN